VLAKQMNGRCRIFNELMRAELSGGRELACHSAHGCGRLPTKVDVSCGCAVEQFVRARPLRWAEDIVRPEPLLYTADWPRGADSTFLGGKIP